MEINFSKLKQKEVISLSDGKNLGKFFDLSIDLQKYNVKGFFATGCKGFRFGKQEIFIPVGNIVKVGEDTVLVEIENAESKDEKPIKPPKRDKVCPPEHPNANCMPQCPPQNCNNFSNRRNLDEYE